MSEEAVRAFMVCVAFWTGLHAGLSQNAGWRRLIVAVYAVASLIVVCGFAVGLMT